jgi:flagellar motor stator protein MotA
MNMLPLAGLLVVLVSVAAGFLLSGGSLLLLWHPTEVLIICGAAAGAFVTSNPKKVLVDTMRGTVALFKAPHYGKETYVDLLRLLNDLLNKLRKEGVMGIEADCEKPQESAIFQRYPKILQDQHMMEFICDCLRLIVSGNLDPHELESLLEYELETHHKEAHQPVHALQQVADALPGFGIVAAVLGIVNTMAAIDGADTATIGHKVAAALVGTFLGILIAYGFVGPLATALKHRVEEESKAFEVVKMALVACVRGYPPKVSVEFARKLLFSEVRPTFADLEGQLKAKPVAPADKAA